MNLHIQKSVATDVFDALSISLSLYAFVFLVPHCGQNFISIVMYPLHLSHLASPPPPPSSGRATATAMGGGVSGGSWTTAISGSGDGSREQPRVR